MLHIAICEDEPYMASKLEQLLAAYLDQRALEAQIQCYPHGEALWAARTTVDLLLMDIKLPGQEGTEVVTGLRSLGLDCPVVFITAYPQYVFQAFDLDAVHYLLKPVEADRLFPALDKAFQRLLQAGCPALWLPQGAGGHKLLCKDILYGEALGHQVTIHTLEGIYPYPGTLDALQAALPAHFFRCHKSYLVNLHAVTGKEAGVAHVVGGGKVLLPRRRQRALGEKLLESCQGGDRI